MNIFFNGIFGSRCAERAATLCPGARVIELDDGNAAELSRLCQADKSLVLLSDVLGAGMKTLAAGLRHAGATWTTVHLYPAMVRVGPLVKAEGVCFECATRRYLSAPGSEGMSRLEELLRGAGEVISFPVVPATVVEMAVTEALRQLDDPLLPAGFIMKIDVIEHAMTSAVALPLHGCGCGCGASPAETPRMPGQRFYLALENDLRELTGGVV